MEKYFSWFNVQKLWQSYSAMDNAQEYVSKCYLITYLLLKIAVVLVDIVV